MAKDYYKILGVERGASDDEIKKSFRRLARQYHPDQAAGDKKEAEAKFKEISEAYEVLGDKQKRSQYDQFGSNGPNFGGGQGFGGFDFSGAGFDFNNAEGFGDIFETFFGGGAAPRRERSGAGTPGGNIEARVRITFTDAIFGTTAEFELTRLKKCEHCRGNGAEPGSKISDCKTCRGTGQVETTRRTVFGVIKHAAVCPDCSGEGKILEQKCTVCHGTGRVRKSEKVKVKIPAGVDSGAVIRLAGQGEAGVKGGSDGDLFVHIQVDSHRDFGRRGLDIYSTQEIHLIQAILGDEVEIKTVHGNVKLRIPSGTQSHQTFKLKDYGAPELNSAKRGDHYVKVVVQIPDKLSAKEKELYSQLAAESGVKLKKKGGLFS